MDELAFLFERRRVSSILKWLYWQRHILSDSSSPPPPWVDGDPVLTAIKPVLEYIEHLLGIHEARFQDLEADAAEMVAEEILEAERA